KTLSVASMRKACCSKIRQSLSVLHDFCSGFFSGWQKPIPGGIVVNGTLFHLFLPGPSNEPSTITDFHGSIGLAHVQGNGTGTSTVTGEKHALLFDVDTRFMQGVYIGMDGERHTGTFSFI